MKKLLLSLAFAATMAVNANADTAAFVVSGTVDADATCQIVNNADKNIVGEKFVSGDITFVLTKNNNTSSNVNGTQVRWYQNDVITLTPADGCTITGVSVAATQGTMTADVGTVSGYEWTGSTIQPLELKASKQVRFTNMVVTYTKAATSSVARPEISQEGNVVTITCATEGAEIYYTEDGETPTTASEKYTAPFELWMPGTVKAIAVKDGESSSVASKSCTYTMGDVESLAVFADVAEMLTAEQLANVEFVVTCPMYVCGQLGQNLWVRDASQNYMLIYGTQTETYKNGDVIAGMTCKYIPYYGLPEVSASVLGAKTEGSAVEPAELEVSEITTAMLNYYVKFTGATLSGVSGRNATLTSAAGETMALYSTNEYPAEGTYDIYAFVGCYKDALQLTPYEFVENGTVVERVATPIIAPASGEYAKGTEITIACETEGASIYYTVDESDPTASSTLYTGAFTLEADMVVKAIAVAEGMEDSEVAEEIFIVKEEGTTAYAAEFDFSNPASLNPAQEVPAASTAIELPGVEFTSNGVSLVGEGGTSTARLWSCGTSGHGVEYRVYNGGTITISGTGIAAIEFTGDNLITLGSAAGTLTGTATAALWKSETPSGESKVVITVTTKDKTKRADIATVKVTRAQTGIENVEIDANAPVEYFNLQGVRVANPENGLYIRRQGNNVSKVYVR